MTPSRLRARIVAERLHWIHEMIRRVAELPLGTYESFRSDPRNAAAAESYVRRALEALMDLGRHILAKGFGHGPTEYKGIPLGLAQRGVLTEDEADLMMRLAGYRNRMAHFYNEISEQELYTICTLHIDDIKLASNALRRWIQDHPEKIDRSL